MNGQAVSDYYFIIILVIILYFILNINYLRITYRQLGHDKLCSCNNSFSHRYVYSKQEKTYDYYYEFTQKTLTILSYKFTNGLLSHNSAFFVAMCS